MRKAGFRIRALMSGVRIHKVAGNYTKMVNSIDEFGEKLSREIRLLEKL